MQSSAVSVIGCQVCSYTERRLHVRCHLSSQSVGCPECSVNGMLAALFGQMGPVDPSCPAKGKMLEQGL